MSEPQPGLAQPYARAQPHDGARQPYAGAQPHDGAPQPYAGAQPHDGARARNARLGEICLARPDRGPDLPVLIVAVLEDQVEALLCSYECDWATETDSVLEPTATGYLRRLLVHGDVAGRILSTRLHATIGRVPPELAERIALRGRRLDFGSTELGRGRAIVDDSDPRWEWKLEKFRRMRALRAGAREVGWSLHELGDPDPREA